MTDLDTHAIAPPISEERLSGILTFLQEAEKLKDTLRSGTTRQNRRESTAEHCWRLCLMLMAFEKDLGRINFLKLMKLAVVHDLGEAISGDIPAPLQTADDDREERERRDFVSLCASLPEDLSRDMQALWDEYAAAETPEAQLAKAFDKLETMLQHHLMPGADAAFHAFNLSYGVERTEKFPLTRQIREVVDDTTRQLIETGNDRESG